jgi:predicted RNA-binding protein with PIN domain
MKYLLDGYNILFREKDARGSLEEQRGRLFDKLSLLAEDSHRTLIVVLDSHHQIGDSERHHYRALEVIYTDFDQTADDYIIEYVERLPVNKRSRVKVVTSDRTLMQKVRLERVEVLPVSSFLKELEKKAHVRSEKRAELHSHTSRSKGDDGVLPNLGDNSSWIAIFEERIKQKKF